MVKRDQLTGHELFKYFRPEQMDRISRVSEVKQYSAGSLVYERGKVAEYLYLVCKGQVVIRVPLASGLSVTVDECKVGDLFGASVFFDEKKHQQNACCIEESEILRIDYADLKLVMEEDPRLAAIMQRQIGEVFYHRYINTMKRLQSIALNLDVQVS